MKVYVVKYEEEGAYIGHGLYETNTFIDNVYSSEEKANARVKELEEFYYSVWVDEMDITD